MTELLCIIGVISGVTDQALIRRSAFVRHWRRIENIMGQNSSYLGTSGKSWIRLIGKYFTTLLLNVILPLNIRKIKTRLIKLTVKFVHVNICLMFFSIQNGLKQGDAPSQLLSEYATMKVQNLRGIKCIETNHYLLYADCTHLSDQT
jgi:hypothetical protein